MNYYKIKEMDLAKASGEYTYIGGMEAEAYMQSEGELKAPFVKLEALPQELLKQVARDLDNLKRLKLNEIACEYEKRINVITQGIPQSEMLTWEAQEREAKAYLQNKEVENAPSLSILASKRGIELEVLCNKVVEKATLYRGASSALIGKRQAYEDKITLAKNINEVSAISWIDEIKESTQESA